MFLKKPVTAILSTIFALGCVSVGTYAKAQEVPNRASSCTNKKLQGDYGSQLSGFQNSGATPFNLLFLLRFDGNGNVAGIKGAASSGGNIAQNITDTGTYQVNSDCTVSVIFTPSADITFTFFGVIVDNGKKVLILETDPGTNISGNFEKVDSKGR